LIGKFCLSLLPQLIKNYPWHLCDLGQKLNVIAEFWSCMLQIGSHFPCCIVLCILNLGIWGQNFKNHLIWNTKDFPCFFLVFHRNIYIFVKMAQFQKSLHSMPEFCMPKKWDMVSHLWLQNLPTYFIIIFDPKNIKIFSSKITFVFVLKTWRWVSLYFFYDVFQFCSDEIWK